MRSLPNMFVVQKVSENNLACQEILKLGTGTAHRSILPEKLKYLSGIGGNDDELAGGEQTRRADVESAGHGMSNPAPYFRSDSRDEEPL